MLPFELPKYLFHDAEAGAKAIERQLRPDRSDISPDLPGAERPPAWSRGQDPVSDSRARPGGAAVSHPAKTLLIWGESDRLVPPAYAQAFKSGLKSADLVMIPEAGHMVAFEKTAEVTKAIHAAYLN